MLLRIQNEIREVEWEEFQEEVLHVAILSEEDIHQNSASYYHLPEEFIFFHSVHLNIRFSKIETYAGFYTGELIKKGKLYQKDRNICYFYISKNYFVLLSHNTNEFTNYLNLLKEQHISKLSLERCIYLFLNEFIKGDIDELENLQDQLTEIDEKIMKENISNFVNLIERPKKNILMLDHYYDHLIEIGEELGENDINIFTHLKYFKIFTNKVERLHNNTQLIKEYSMQIQEAYQAMMDCNLNSIMKLLTVLTAIFQPLTLIVGWYGMNFTGMPELSWRYGYIFVILLSLSSLGICFWYFRKKKFL